MVTSSYVGACGPESARRMESESFVTLMSVLDGADRGLSKLSGFVPFPLPFVSSVEVTDKNYHLWWDPL